MAIQAFQRVLKKKPDDAGLWERLGIAHMKMQRMSSAQKVRVRMCLPVPWVMCLVFCSMLATGSQETVCMDAVRCLLGGHEGV